MRKQPSKPEWRWAKACNVRPGPTSKSTGGLVIEQRAQSIGEPNGGTNVTAPIGGIGGVPASDPGAGHIRDPGNLRLLRWQARQKGFETCEHGFPSWRNGRHGTSRGDAS
jgi:hypothetical protein